MKRLTTNDADHILAPLNLFYAENQEVMIRGGGPEPDYADTTLVELVRRIAKTHDLRIEAESPESLGDEMYEAMFDGVDTIEGVVALLHTAAVQATEMRGRLEMIEDILGDEYDLDRLRELAQANREKRVYIEKKAYQCPKCGSHRLTPRVDGKFYFCFNCKEQFPKEAEASLRGAEV